MVSLSTKKFDLLGCVRPLQFQLAMDKSGKEQDLG
jgi:hypothetical protein